MSWGSSLANIGEDAAYALCEILPVNTYDQERNRLLAEATQQVRTFYSVCIELCGHKFELDIHGYPTNVPGYQNRWRRATRSPLKCAHYAIVYLEAFIAEILGWTKDGMQDPNRGIFGNIRYFWFKSETNKRYSLHWHGIICQAQMDPANLAAYLASPELKSRMRQTGCATSPKQAHHAFPFEWLCSSTWPGPNRYYSD
jgi:hypothetical protein